MAGYGGRGVWKNTGKSLVGSAESIRRRNTLQRDEGGVVNGGGEGIGGYSGENPPYFFLFWLSMLDARGCGRWATNFNTYQLTRDISRATKFL